ncbi:Peptidoglycan-binding Lysin subgroup [Penicillium italicum]|uniref:Peptidoglycan-binding Lysin subgroup n=1 Tax=Penicillium italicum TaxID=40296 RepID=A0A0A2KCK2_PENIT|nr:Peptidoglycan-binding Lysin subgroup [Penicillium italicum]
MAGSSFRLVGLLALALGSVEGRPQFSARSATPGLPSDPNTISTCTWWWDNVDGTIACADVPFQWGISMEDFLLWNPSITADCGNYLTGQSYCVEAPTATTPGTKEPALTSSNGVETPQPTQPGMVDDCDSFYLTKAGDSSTTIASKHGISKQQFLNWNPSVGSDSTGLWADTYVCVGLIGTTHASASATSTGNGIATPTPTQPGMADNCDGFYLAKTGESCAAIASKHGISRQQLLSWNPSIATMTTTTGNGIPTPTPIQDGMVGNCEKFHFVIKGDVCVSIASKYSITVADFIKWNPAVNSDCTGILAHTYACVGLI